MQSAARPVTPDVNSVTTDELITKAISYRSHFPANAQTCAHPDNPVTSALGLHHRHTNRILLLLIEYFHCNYKTLISTLLATI